ncbi:ParB/RepB/Spo0J family partition protein [Magnetospirillum molischianum]|uniref:Putative ParB domain protein n=1 Tax=Magnetospirillum molischianum DSM 120 TaxID=1150626 RepID=H8FY32_MAGML|nr:ParB/RepB/Spo0J family partition protein [Magnetospirillum molischianum]CCG43270.1 putative ParB domain protein [Magnetospirillum molischianum DSM 120]
MKQLDLDPRLLKPNPWNTNIMSPDNEAKLDESIRRFGMFKPVVVRELPDGSLEILGGEHRNEAAIRLRLPTIPVVNLGPIDDHKAKEIGLVDNGRYGADDTLALADLLSELGSAEDLAEFLPYSDTELSAIFSSSSIVLDDLETFGEEEDPTKEPSLKMPKTHTIQRFKVPLEDAERISELIEKTMREQGFTESDALTNAGDALVFLLRNS